MLLRCQHDVKGYNATSVLFPEVLLKQRVTCANEVDVRRFLHRRLETIHLPGYASLGLDEVDLCQELIGIEHLAYMRPDTLRHLREDTDNLLPLLTFELPDLVVCFYHLCWLDIHSAPRSALIVDDTRDLSFQSRGHRDDKAPVTHGGSSILIYDALALSGVKDAIENTRHGTCRMRHLATDIQQLRRGVVADVTKLINNLVDLLDDDRERRDTVSEIVESRIIPVLQHNVTVVVLVGQLLTTIEKLHEIVDCLQRAAQIEELALLHPCVLQSDSFQAVAHIEETRERKIVFLLPYPSHLAKFLHPCVYLFRILGERHLLHQAFAQCREACAAQLVFYLVKSYLLFKILWVYHNNIYLRPNQATSLHLP